MIGGELEFSVFPFFLPYKNRLVFTAFRFVYCVNEESIGLAFNAGSLNAKAGEFC